MRDSASWLPGGGEFTQPIFAFHPSTETLFTEPSFFIQLRVSPFFGRDSANHAIATRSNFLRFGKRSSSSSPANLETAPIGEGGDDGDVNEAFEGPIRRDYREFVR